MTKTIIYASVTTAFRGVKDGEFDPVSLSEGDPISGDLAASSIKAKLAKKITEKEYMELQPTIPPENEGGDQADASSGSDGDENQNSKTKTDDNTK